MAGLRLSEIWIYPIKSLGGIRVKSAKVFEKGLEYDRRWMLIDSDNNFMTQRINPNMALFKWSMVDGQWSINYKTDSITFPFSHSISQSSNDGQGNSRAQFDNGGAGQNGILGVAAREISKQEE